jgi:hypothetical protein
VLAISAAVVVVVSVMHGIAVLWLYRKQRFSLCHYTAHISNAFCVSTNAFVLLLDMHMYVLSRLKSLNAKHQKSYKQ